MKFDFDPLIAKEVGVECAIMLSNITWWCKTNAANKRKENFHEWRYWTFNSVKAWSELFPFWTQKQVRRILETLEKSGHILVGEFNDQWYDRTKWYCPNGNIDLPKRANGDAQMGEPIPDSKQDNKQTISSLRSDIGGEPLELEDFEKARDSLDSKKEPWEHPPVAEAPPVVYGNAEINSLISEVTLSLRDAGFAYKYSPMDRWFARHILTAKAFREQAELANLSPHDFALAILKISYQDRFWAGKINNCESIYRKYADIWNSGKAKYASSQSLIIQ